MTKKKCPICELELNDYSSNGDRYHYDCTRCGKFSLTGTANSLLPIQLSGTDDIKRAVLSHSVCKMQRHSDWPCLNSQTYEQILQHGSLPKPAEQAQNLILWLGQTAEASDSLVKLNTETLQAIIGGRLPKSVEYIASHLMGQNLITYKLIGSVIELQMKFEGWEYFEQLQNESTDSRTVFMAMKFGDKELDNIVDNVFRPAVDKTGFELRVLTDVPKAGLIDDRLRIEIRRSRFLITDITHRNPGAYWEAGFAEGLGKPVIYTCKKDAFENGVSHFDTNHHLTVMWHEDEAQIAEDLKATIRATLPTEAKLDD